jgi:hypothetical protein
MRTAWGPDHRNKKRCELPTSRNWTFAVLESTCTVSAYRALEVISIALAGFAGRRPRLFDITVRPRADNGTLSFRL